MNLLLTGCKDTDLLVINSCPLHVIVKISELNKTNYKNVTKLLNSFNDFFAKSHQFYSGIKLKDNRAVSTNFKKYHFAFHDFYKIFSLPYLKKYSFSGSVWFNNYVDKIFIIYITDLCEKFNKEHDNLEQLYERQYSDNLFTVRNIEDNPFYFFDNTSIMCRDQEIKIDILEEILCFLCLVQKKYKLFILNFFISNFSILVVNKFLTRCCYISVPPKLFANACKEATLKELDVIFEWPLCSP